MAEIDRVIKEETKIISKECQGVGGADLSGNT